jgi:hypothetical protein
MRPRIKGAWIAAGIAALGAMIAGGQARAGSIGIVINPGGIKPGTGDPTWDYVLQVYLDPGFEVKASSTPSNFFQVGSSSTPLVGVGTDSPTTQPGTVQWVPAPATDTVTWTLSGKKSVINTGPGELYLGEFVVETDKSFSSPPVAPGTVIDYNFRVLDLATGQIISGSNSFTLVALGVPEPSSVVMLAVGAAAMSVIVIRGRRRAARSA